ncbi:MAG: TolC family protein [Desulfuromonadaceae bacterium]|nr:TolC family protein [Desulfuromonadaceae bacterium]MDD2849273.1 TolC family protein [Desulfuromonadaceae bacterium]MDD4131900.1 TolC family protein [Desulfuromonadaceae bacterium]
MKSFLYTCIAAWLLFSLTGTTFAAETPPPTTGMALTLDDCIRMALKAAPELGEADSDIALASSKLDEAKSYRFPRLEMTALVGPAPTANRSDISPVVRTDRGFSFDSLTWFTSADATIIQPLYTFGKISENMKAATHGIEVDRSRKQQRANEIVQQVNEYYNGLLLAREMKELVLEVQEILTRSREKAQKLLEQGSDTVDQMDLYKLDAFSGMAAKYLEEAKKGEELALAALKARMGLPANAQLETGTERLVIVDVEIPPLENYVQSARQRRPEFHQISEGLKARTALVEAAKANYYPDVFLGGLFSWAYAEDRERVKNPYINDPLNHLNAGVALGARWKLDFGITTAKVAGERAQYNRLLSTRVYADTNVPLQVQKYYLELIEAKNSAAATRSAYMNAKKWAVTAIANFDFGLGPAKDIFEALQAYSTMRADFFKSIYNYRIAAANLDYATNEPLHSHHK